MPTTKRQPTDQEVEIAWGKYLQDGTLDAEWFHILRRIFWAARLEGNPNNNRTLVQRLRRERESVQRRIDGGRLVLTRLTRRSNRRPAPSASRPESTQDSRNSAPTRRGRSGARPAAPSRAGREAPPVSIPPPPPPLASSIAPAVGEVPVSTVAGPSSTSYVAVPAGITSLDPLQAFADIALAAHVHTSPPPPQQANHLAHPPPAGFVGPVALVEETKPGPRRSRRLKRQPPSPPPPPPPRRVRSRPTPHTRETAPPFVPIATPAPITTSAQHTEAAATDGAILDANSAGGETPPAPVGSLYAELLAASLNLRPQTPGRDASVDDQAIYAVLRDEWNRQHPDDRIGTPGEEDSNAAMEGSSSGIRRRTAQETRDEQVALAVQAQEYEMPLEEEEEQGQEPLETGGSGGRKRSRDEDGDASAAKRSKNDDAEAETGNGGASGSQSGTGKLDKGKGRAPTPPPSPTPPTPPAARPSLESRGDPAFRGFLGGARKAEEARLAKKRPREDDGEGEDRDAAPKKAKRDGKGKGRE